MNRRQLLKYFTSSGFLHAISGISPVIAKAASSDNKNTALIYDKAYLKHLMTAGHPESPERLLSIINELHTENLTQFKVEFTTIAASIVETYLKYIHTEQHISALKQRHTLSHETLLKVVSDVLSATQAVCEGEFRNAFCATRPPGHHAENTGKIEGFCLYNIIAIAARYAQQHLNIERVLIIDWDYHHGNGTESAFYSDPSVLFFSTHDLYAYPGTGDPLRKGEGDGEGYNINVHLPCGTDDEMIINAFKEHLIPAANKFKPELILISAGFDSRKDDLLGCYEITDRGFAELTKLTIDLANKHCDGKIVSILEGGYNLEGNAKAVVSHVKALMS